MMLKKTFLAGLIALAGSALASEFRLPAYATAKLPNGLNVYLMERHDVPLVAVRVISRAGGALDGAQAGLANLTADGVLLGSKKYSKQALDDAFDFRGANIGGGSGVEFSMVAASFARDDVATLLPMLADIVQQPSFPEHEFGKLRARTMDELKQAKESPRNVVRSYYAKLLYGEGVYGNPIEGTGSSLAKLKRSDLAAFHRRYYRPDTSAVVVVGDFKTAEMRGQIEQLFGNWRAEGAPPAALPASPTQASKARVLLVNKEDARETTFLFGGAGISRGDPDYVPLQVINTVLGGRFTSWLNDELRVNSGLTYGAGSGFTTYGQNGTFAVSSFTALPKTEAALALATETYQRLWTRGIDAETLESAKAYVKGQFPPRYETGAQLAGLLGEMFIYGFGDEQVNQFSQKVDSLTPEQARVLIDKHFPKDKLQMVLVGKAEAIRPIAAKYGEVLEVDIKADGFAAKAAR